MDSEGLHEIEQIIAQRKMADAAKATAEAEAARETNELAVKVIGALTTAEEMLQKKSVLQTRRSSGADARRSLDIKSTHRLVQKNC